MERHFSIRRALAVPAPLVALVLVAAAPPAVHRQQRPANVEIASFPSEWAYEFGSKAAFAGQGMVASNSAAATEAGVEILRAGGNAVDAAVAVGFALAVAYPEAGNIGGGGFAVVRLAGGESAALDYRETAPSGASRDMFVRGGRLTGESLVGHKASGVPGSVSGLLALLDRYGRFSRQRVMAPALRLAVNGILVDDILRDSISGSADLIGRFSGRALFLPGGRPPASGERVVQRQLAATLQLVSEQGADGFYKGPVARAIVEEMKSGKGLITLEDLAGYRAAWREPIRGSYRGFRLLAMPPSSSGGVTLVEAMNILETWAEPAPWGTSRALNRLAAAFQLAFVDRNEHLGDPDFVDVPVERLTSKGYARQLRGSIEENRAMPAPRPGRLAFEPTETTNYAVVDRWGNAVATTTTINSLYGSGVWVPEGGFFLNNEMDDFAARPGTPNQFGLVQGEANAIAPGKRMLSAMAPTIVVDGEGRVSMVLGARGGPRIITAVAQVIVNVVDYGMSLADAVGAPRIHHQGLPAVLEYEKGGVAEEVVRALEAMGHATKPGGTGNLTAIRRVEGGWEGVVDPRKHGRAAGY